MTPKTKSDAWNHFNEIFQNDQKIPFVICATCRWVCSYDPGKGNNTLLRHIRTCNVGSSIPGKSPKPTTGFQPKATSFCAPQSKPLQKAIKDLNSAIVVGLAKDLRPLRAVEGKGMQHLMQSLINFGATFGCQDVRTVVRHRTTLKREYLPRVLKDELLAVTRKLGEAPQNPTFAFTTDMWTEKHNSRSFLSLSIHFVNAKWNLETYLLGVDEFSDKKSTENIREECTRILGKFFEADMLSTIINSSWIITDGGSNLQHVFPNRLDCQCHRLNLVVKWMLNDSVPKPDRVTKRQDSGKPYPEKSLFKLTEKCPTFSAALSNVKDLVTYFKRTELNSALPIRLKQDVVTRWNSRLDMLDSFQKSAEEMKAILLRQKKNVQLQKLMEINEDSVSRMIKFLQPFKDCTEAFSRETNPTIHEVVPWWYKLKLHSQNSSDDSEELRILKQHTRNLLEEYTCEDPIYGIAAFLDHR